MNALISRYSNFTSGLAGKANVNHAHAYSVITDKPSTFPPSEHNHDTLYIKKSTDRVDNTYGTAGVFQHRDGGKNLFYCLSTGVYSVAPTDTGNPVSVYGILLVFNTSSGDSSAPTAWIKQVLFPNGQNKIYVRENINYNASTWSSWKYFTLSES